VAHRRREQRGWRSTEAETPHLRGDTTRALAAPQGVDEGDVEKSRSGAQCAPNHRGALCRTGGLAPTQPCPTERLSARSPQGREPAGLSTLRAPGLKDTHAEGAHAGATFRQAAQPARRDGPSAPAVPRPAAKGSERGAHGGPSRLEGHSKLEYRYPYQRLFRTTLHKARYQAST
jgi:hypothetical protein